MQFLSSSYNDYYVHPLFASRLPSSSHNLIPLLILNNILFMLCAFFSPASSSSLCCRRLSCIIVCVLSSSFASLFSLYLSTKPLTTSTKFFIYLSSFFVFCEGGTGGVQCFNLLYPPVEKEVVVSYVTVSRKFMTFEVMKVFDGKEKWNMNSFFR
jgi:hypothetical protein